MYIEYPNQRVSLSEKQKISWFKPMYDYLIAKSANNRDINKIKNRILNANGVISEDEFTYLVKPVDTSGVKFDLPGKIRDIDFINPIREKAIGSYSQLPYNFQVKVANDDIVPKRDVDLRDAVLDLMNSKLAEHLESIMGGEQPQQLSPKQYQEEIDKFIKQFMADWNDDRAIQGQKILNHINDTDDYDFNRIKAYTYWWMCEEVYTKRSIINGRLVREVIPPYEIYPIDNGAEFVEDYDGVVRTYTITYPDFLAKLSNLLTDEQMNLLVKNISNHTEGYYYIPSSIFKLVFDIDVHTENLNGDEVRLSGFNGDFIINHIEFKSESEYIIRHYNNELGQPKEMIVDNDYIIQPELGDIGLSSIWITEVYEGYKIGDNQDAIYIKPTPLEIQRRDVIDLKKVKLSYGGKKGIMSDVLINPIASRLIPYLVYYKIIHLHIERTLAKYQSSIKFIPKELVEGDEEMTRKDKIWFMKADNTMLYDHTEISPNEVSQGVIIKGDPDISNYIKSLLELRLSFKQEAQELANMNDELVGKGDPRGNVTNNQNNIAMARLGSVFSNNVFNKVLSKDLLADLDWSKAVFKEPISLQFKNNNGDVEYFDINPDNHNSSFYGISISNSDMDERLLQQYKDWAFNVSQNGDLNISFEAISTDNVSGIKKLIRKLINDKMEFDKNMAEREAANKEEATALERERLDKELSSKEKIAIIQSNATIQAELIKADTEMMKLDATTINNDKDEDGKDDSIELAIKQATLRLNERSQSLAEQQHYNKISMDNHKKNMDKENLKIKKTKPSSK